MDETVWSVTMKYAGLHLIDELFTRQISPYKPNQGELGFRDWALGVRRLQLASE